MWINAESDFRAPKIFSVVFQSVLGVAKVCACTVWTDWSSASKYLVSLFYPGFWFGFKMADMSLKYSPLFKTPKPQAKRHMKEASCNILHTFFVLKNNPNNKYKYCSFHWRNAPSEGTSAQASIATFVTGHCLFFCFFFYSPIALWYWQRQ